MQENIDQGLKERAGRLREKARGAILQRAGQYTHHLEGDEARIDERWTLEKLVKGKAVGDLQAQSDDMRRMWK